MTHMPQVPKHFVWRISAVLVTRSINLHVNCIFLHVTSVQIQACS